jgi:rRNA-processing protein FCF1
MIPDWLPLKRKVLLDANLLVVLVAGMVDEALLRDDALSGYTLADYRLIESIATACEEIFVTPYLLAEVNSLLNKTGYQREECREVFAKMLIPNLTEQYTPGRALALELSLMRDLGLTDVSVIDVGSQSDLFVFTADGPLYGFLKHLRIPAIYYNDIKYLAEDF